MYLFVYTYLYEGLLLFYIGICESSTKEAIQIIMNAASCYHHHEHVMIQYGMVVVVQYHHQLAYCDTILWYGTRWYHTVL